jgi:ATP-dependent Clp protease ATP-binding subunit ClpC
VGRWVFERFTEPARQTIVLAQEEARALNHNYLGTEHILLGLLREWDGVAYRALDSLGVTIQEVREQVARIVGHGEELPPGQIPFTPRAKKVLELSLREARALDSNYIGTEHLLLAVVGENDGVAARILLDLEADAERIRSEVIRLLGGAARFGGGASRVPTKTSNVLRLRRMPRGHVDYATRRGLPPLLVGWLLFAVPLGVGILIGWLIWG